MFKYPSRTLNELQKQSESRGFLRGVGDVLGDNKTERTLQRLHRSTKDKLIGPRDAQSHTLQCYDNLS